MKLVTHLYDEHEQLAIYHNGFLYNMDRLHPDLPNTMSMLLNYWDDMIDAALKLNHAILDGRISVAKGIPFNSALVLAPVPFPTSCRHIDAFGQHMVSLVHNRPLSSADGLGKFPAYYFANHNAFTGPGAVSVMPDHLEQLDFALEFAIVISRNGRNIPAAEAGNHIAGLLILNALSARELQVEDMMGHAGHAKGKDFSTAIGPWLVTLDELEEFEIPAKEGHTGTAWNLSMKCRVNGTEVSSGKTGDMEWTFAEMIERCSYGVTLLAGDVITSGPVGNGCFLELNVAGKRNNPAYKEQWLQNGDVVELEIDGLGILTNTIEAEETD